MTKRYVETIQSEFRRALGLTGKHRLTPMGFDPDDFTVGGVIGPQGEPPSPIKGQKRRSKRMIQV